MRLRSLLIVPQFALYVPMALGGALCGISIWAHMKLVALRTSKEYDNIVPGW